MMGNEEGEGTFKEEPREDTRSGQQHHVHELDLFLSFVLFNFINVIFI